MTTNMNFGPEWMRGSFPKQTTNGGTSDILDSLLSFEEQQQQHQQQENPFKYSKDFMLSLFKPDSNLPFDFNQHEYVTTDKIVSPLAFEELTESEKKLLSGPVHSEASSRKSNAQRHRGDLYSSSPMQSPASENGPTTPGGNRLGQRKARTGDYFGKDQSLKRAESDVMKRRDQGDEMTLGKMEDEGREPNWNNKGSSLGAFSSSALFGDNDTFKSSTDTLFGGNSNSNDLGGLSNMKKPENTKWLYRDPSGQVQGPFEAQEMQDWYKAGFFTPTLMLCREDETVFEPLMVLTQKVGNEDTPFLAPRPRLPIPGTSSSNDLFGNSEGLFRNDKYMPFGGAPTTPGGSFLNNAPTTPLYQSPYYGGNSLLRDNRWDQQPQASPSWLNSNPSGDLFSNPSSPFSQQPTQSLNPVFGSNLNSPGIFDYHQRAVTDQLDQHQQYMQMLQQNQQQRSMQFQQHFQPPPLAQQPMQPMQQQQQQQQQQQMQQQQQPQQQMHQQQEQETSPQNAFKNLTLDSVSNLSNHASPVLRSNILSTSGWGSSAPGTPIGEVPSSPWGSIVSTAIPTKVSEELQAKAPGAQSPRAPSSPKKPIEKPIKPKAIIESFADIQLAEQKKAAAAAAAATVSNTPVSIVPTKETKEEPTKVASTPAPVVTKPIVSLREIQQEELRIANEKKAKQAKAPAAPSWATSSGAPLHSNNTVTSSNTWSQPAHKPLSLREIQELEAKEQQQKSAAEYLTQQERLANATPSTLSWGVVVPNNKSAPIVTPTSSSSSAAWTAPSGPKKTLREIQQEEELAMKKKNAKAIKNTTTAATIAAAAAANSNNSSRAYAVAPSAGGAWTTVTNTRVPKPVVAASTAAPTPAVREPVRWEPVTKPSVSKVRSGPSEDFRRWCKKALRDLNSGVNQEEIISMLVSFPVDASAAEIIEDVIYANSLRIDGKRFAQEFMKRRKADIAGRLDIVTAGLEDEDEDDFKVVIKKGKKKTT